MKYLKEDCIEQLMKESEERYEKASEANNEEAMNAEDAYINALYDVLNWIEEHKTPVEVPGGELEMVAV